MKQALRNQFVLLLLAGTTLSGCGGSTSSATTQPPLPPVVQNQGPTATAGADFLIIANTTATLDGLVTDDGLPNPPASVAATWSTISGPGTTTFADLNNPLTTVSFDLPGNYLLLLTADDSALQHGDELTVTVEPEMLPSVLVAADDSFSTTSGVIVSGDVTADNGNGADLTGQFPVSAILGSNVAQGQLDWNGTGTFDYTPDAEFSGVDSFSYTLTDESSAISNAAAVTIDVAAQKSGKPNILFFLADDMGWGDLIHYNPLSRIEMPNIERLANEGVRFMDAHTAAAKCAPSRYSALTGNYHWRGRFSWGQWQYKGGSQIRDDQETLGDILQSAGYVTASIGKQHLGGDFYRKQSNSFVTANGDDDEVDFSRRFKNGPLDHGFDYSFLTLRGIQTWPYAYFENDRLVGAPDNLMIWTEGKHGGSTIQKEGIGMPYWDSRNVGPDLVQAAVDFIDRHHQTNIRESTSTPFFMYYASQSAHSPYTPPDFLLNEPVKGVTGMNRHTDMIYEIDVALGALITALEERGLVGNTLIVFTSDNGGIPNEVNLGHDSVGGLRGKKGQIHEGGHRVPLIFKWGDGTTANSVFPPGTETNQLAAIQDIVATVAAVVGTEVVATQARDSLNMLPVLLGERSDSDKVRKTLVMEADEDITGQVPRHFAIREHSWKLIFDENNKPVELYNLGSDLYEKTNRIDEAAQQERIERMRDRLEDVVS